MKKIFFSIISFSVFALALPALAATPTIVSAKITGPNTVTIIYSEAVNTKLGDYSSFSGALNGRNLTAITGSGTNTIILTFDSGAFAPDANGWLSVATTTSSISDNSPFTQSNVTVTDGQPPILSSLAISSNNTNNTFAKIGNAITVTFSTNEAINNPSLAIEGHSVYLSGSGNGPFTASYTLASGDTENSVPLTINFSDLAGNNGIFSAAIANSAGASVVSPSVVTSASAPVIYQVTPIPVYSITAAPSYTFNSTSNGTIHYNGSCSSATSAASIGNNTITFNSLANGFYNNCSLTVTDANNNVSNQLNFSPFTIDTNALISPPASAVSVFKFLNPLKVGSTGNDVMELQKRLTNEGVYSGPITGKFGALTETAVKKYQKLHGLQQLGNVGPGTRAELNK